MKKTIMIILIMILTVMVFATTANAMTQAELKEYILGKHIVSGHEVELTSSEKKQVRDFFDTHTLTDEQADYFKAKAEECREVMNKAGVSQVQQLSKADKQKILSLAHDVGEKIGVNVDMSTGLVTDKKTGEPLFKLPQGKLVQTGSNNIPYIVVAGLAIIAVAGTVTYKKVRS